VNAMAGFPAARPAADSSICPPPSESDVRFLQRVSGFCREEVDPHTCDWDLAEEIPREVFSRAAAVGLCGMLAPVEFGGLGLSMQTYARAIQEVGKHDGALGMNLAAHNALLMGHILHHGSEKQRRRWVPPLAGGASLGAWALTEPAAGSDASALETTGTLQEDGWRISGRKLFITGGRRADVLVVIAVTGTAENGRREISAFLVPGSGVQPVRKVPTLGMRASDTAEIRLEGAQGELVGERGSGQKQFLSVLDQGRIGIAALAIGIGRAALETAIAWVKQRQVFLRPLADQQLVQAMLADNATELDAAELLTLRAAAMQDAGQPTTKESAMAKLYASEAACRACDSALQLHGGRGYSRDLPLERYMRDARLCRIGEGASEVLRVVIAREIFGVTRRS